MFTALSGSLPCSSLMTRKESCGLPLMVSTCAGTLDAITGIFLFNLGILLLFSAFSLPLSPFWTSAAAWSATAIGGFSLVVVATRIAAYAIQTILCPSCCQPGRSKEF